MGGGGLWHVIGCGISVRGKMVLGWEIEELVYDVRTEEATASNDEDCP
jgi:hypothetical protein